MDPDLFLQQVRDLPVEEGRAYIQEHIEELSDHKAIGESLAEEALRVLYTPFLSLKLAELLIFYGEYTGHLLSHALGLKAKGDVLERIDHHQAAMDALDTAGEEFLQFGDEGNWARSRISWVYAAGWLGRIEDALKVGEQARNVFLRLGEPYWACVIDNNIAVILEYSGRHEDALTLYENMLTLFPTVTNQGESFVQRSIAITQLNQAVSLFWLGEYERAYFLLQQAQAILKTLGETDLVIIVEGNLAELDYMQGYYGSALRRYYLARELIKEKDGSSLFLAELKISMANCLVKLNRAQEACLVAEEAVQEYRRNGMSQSIREVLHEYANILVASGRLKEALTVLDEIWNLFNVGGFDPLANLARLQQAEILLEMDSTTAAYDLACLVKTYFDARNLVAPSVRASLVMIGALIKKAQEVSPGQEEQTVKLLEEAISLCKQTVSQAHQNHLQEGAYKSHFLMGHVFSLQGNVARAMKQYRIAIAQIERILNDLVHDLSPSFLRTTWAVYEELIALYLEQAQNEQAFAYLERVRSLTLRQYLHKLKRFHNEENIQGETPSMMALRTQKELKDWQEKYRNYSVLLADFDSSVSTTIDKEIVQVEMQRCEAKVHELFERLHLQQLDTHTNSRATHARKRKRAEGELLKAQYGNLEYLRQHLLPDQLLLAYYLYKDSLVIFAINREGMITYENPNGAVQLEHLLTFLPAHLQPGGWPDPLHPPQQAIRRLLHKLYNLLIAPVELHLPSSSGYLTIVPYGSLHTLPFHALYDGTHYLIENFRVSYLPASSLLIHLRDVESESSIPPEVATGMPLVFGYSGKGQLQRVQDEAKDAAAMLEGNCYLEHEATIARLIEKASGSPVIHLATHGQSRLDAPNFSYVRLADGQLNAIDAFSLNLKGCELVTLSGCETGLALSSGADEQLGLGRAFLAAGATSLVMSLWPVEDSSTNELMKLLYQHLLQGESKAQALRAAQCSLLYREEPRNAHPYFWAAFRLVGDVGPLRYQRTRDVLLASTTQPPKTATAIVEMSE
jgi:CHAT domain-containing protein